MDTSPLQTMFGKVVRLRRIALGYSQEELADVVGLHVTHISSVERGLANLTFQNMERIADALQTPLSALLTEAEYRMKFEAEQQEGEKKRRRRTSPDAST